MLPNIWFIESYSLMMVLGIGLAFLFMELYFRKHLKVSGSKLYYIEICLLGAVLFGLIGAYLFQNVYNFIEDPSSYHWEWSLTFYGGVICGAGGFFLLWFLYGTKHYSEGLSRLIIVAPGCITAAHSIGRIGCFMAGCCYGKETTAWYGIQFPEMTHKVIPTNLFEAIFLMILSAVLLYLAFKKDYKNTFPIYFISYGIWRFLIEYVRGDHRGNFIPGISPSQFWSLLLIIAGVAWFVFVIVFKKKSKNTAQN